MLTPLRFSNYKCHVIEFCIYSPAFARSIKSSELFFLAQTKTTNSPLSHPCFTQEFTLIIIKLKLLKFYSTTNVRRIPSKQFCKACNLCSNAISSSPGFAAMTTFQFNIMPKKHFNGLKMTISAICKGLKIVDNDILCRK